MPGRSYTPEQREAADQARRQQVEELHELLAERIGSLDNKAEWEAYLRFARGFTNYSFLNRLAIMAQRAGRDRRRRLPGLAGQGLPGPPGREGDPHPRPRHPAGRRCSTPPATRCSTRTGGRGRPARSSASNPYRSGTSANATDHPSPRRPRRCCSPARRPPGCGTAWPNSSRRRASPLERGDCGEANGITNFATRTVRVRDDVDDAMCVRVLAHELGHVLLAHPTTAAGLVDCRGVREVEAESVSFMVVGAHGLDASQYTLPLRHRLGHPSLRQPHPRTGRPRHRPASHRDRRQDPRPHPAPTLTVRTGARRARSSTSTGRSPRPAAGRQATSPQRSTAGREQVAARPATARASRAVGVRR